MAERVAEPEVAWYRLTRAEVAVLGLLCAVLVALCIVMVAGGRGPQELTQQHTDLPPARVNVNTASAAELMALPGIGERKAERIIQARQTKPIRTLEEFAKAAGGIPVDTLQRLRPYVLFGDEG